MKLIVSLFVIVVLAFVQGTSAQVAFWDGTVPACDQYIAMGTPIAVGGFNLSFIAAQITPKLAALAVAGPSCRTVFTELICRQAFQPMSPLGPARPCNTVCRNVTEFCFQTLALVNQLALLPDCIAADGIGPLYPDDGTNYGYGLVSCQQQTSNDGSTFLFPSFYCDVFEAPANPVLQANTTFTYNNCSSKIESQYDNNWVFMTDQASQVQIAIVLENTLKTLYEAYTQRGLPYTCYLASVERACGTAFNPCMRIPNTVIGTPVDIFVPSPPCKSVCDAQTQQCAQAFLLGGQYSNIADCAGQLSPFPGLLQYPEEGWTFSLNGQTLFRPCIPSSLTNQPPTFSCQPFNATAVPICAPFINGSVFVPPPYYTQENVAAAVSQALRATSALPTPCQTFARELICKSGLQQCFSQPIPLPYGNGATFDFLFGKPPCQNVCNGMTKQCSQVLSLVGQSSSIPDCSAISSATQQPTYPQQGLLFPFGPLGNATIPCVPIQTKTTFPQFSCDKFEGKPKECKPFVKYSFMVTPQITQSYIAEQVAANLKGTEALPDDVRLPLTEFICHAGFQKCDTTRLDGIVYNWGRPPCYDDCKMVVKQASNIFVLAGKGDSIPDCDAIDSTTGQAAYPDTDRVYYVGSDTMTVPCNSNSKKYNDPVIECKPYKGDAKFCKKYIANKVYINAALDEDTSAQVLNQFEQLLLEADKECRAYAEKLACTVLLPECEIIKVDGVGKLVFPHPPCYEICKDIPKPKCYNYFKQMGIPIPDCKEKDPLTGQPRYPKKEWRWEIGGQTIKTKCAD